MRITKAICSERADEIAKQWRFSWDDGWSQLRAGDPVERAIAYGVFDALRELATGDLPCVPEPQWINRLRLKLVPTP